MLSLSSSITSLLRLLDQYLETITILLNSSILLYCTYFMVYARVVLTCRAMYLTDKVGEIHRTIDLAFKLERSV